MFKLNWKKQVGNQKYKIINLEADVQIQTVIGTVKRCRITEK